MKSLPSLQVYTKILELIDTHSGGLSLSEIANLLELPKSTNSSILKLLAATSQWKDFLATQKMYVKAWRNQWLQMRHRQIAHPFYKMELQMNTVKDGGINYAGLQGEHIPDE